MRHQAKKKTGKISSLETNTHLNLMIQSIAGSLFLVLDPGVLTFQVISRIKLVSIKMTYPYSHQAFYRSLPTILVPNRLGEIFKVFFYAFVVGYRSLRWGKILDLTRTVRESISQKWKGMRGISMGSSLVIECGERNSQTSGIILEVTLLFNTTNNNIVCNFILKIKCCGLVKI